MERDTILEVRHLHTCFRVGSQKINILKDVSFDVYKGKTLAIVGESGCGKSVTVHSVVKLLPKNGKMTGGTVTFRHDDREYRLDEMKPYGKEMRDIRGKVIGMIFQDPMASLNPVYKVGQQVAENLMQHEKIGKKEALMRVEEMFKKLGIPEPSVRVNSYPHQFSGGMKQRVMIAIAMICNPQLLIADEPTTALDVTIQAQIIELMKKMAKEEQKSIILITHNMGLVAEAADYVAVMYMGRVMEYGEIHQIFQYPSHPYTEALMKSVPVLGMDEGRELETIPGITPNPADLKEGCEFAGRCGYCTERCRKGTIPEYETEPGHRVRCLRYSNFKEVVL